MLTCGACCEHSHLKLLSNVEFYNNKCRSREKKIMPALFKRKINLMTVRNISL